MNSIFLIHLISTIITIFFVVVIWWTNRKIIALNRELIKDSREVLVLNGLLQERMNNIEAINKIDAIDKAFELKDK